MIPQWEIGLHQTLIVRIRRVLEAMSALGFPMKVTSGLRTVGQQQALYASGRTRPGPIVTHADGVLKVSNHQAGSDGVGAAVDCAFQGPDPYLAKDARQSATLWACYGAMVEAVGLVWGGRFSTISDRTHAEL